MVKYESVDPFVASYAGAMTAINGFLIGSVAYVLYKNHKENKELNKKLNVIEKYYQNTDDSFVPFSEFERKVYKVSKNFDGTKSIGERDKKAEKPGLFNKKSQKILMALDRIAEYTYKGKPVFQYGTVRDTGKSTMSSSGYKISTEYEDHGFFKLCDKSYKKYFYFYLAKASGSTGAFIEEAVTWINNEYKRIRAVDKDVLEECLEEVIMDEKEYLESAEALEDARNEVLDAVEAGYISMEDAEAAIADLDSVVLEHGGARNRYVSIQKAKWRDEIKKLETEKKRLQRLSKMATGDRKLSYDNKIKKLDNQISVNKYKIEGREHDGVDDAATIKYDSSRSVIDGIDHKNKHKTSWSTKWANYSARYDNHDAREKFNKDFGGPTKGDDPYARPVTRYKGSGTGPDLPKKKAVTEEAIDVLNNIHDFLEEAYDE